MCGIERARVSARRSVQRNARVQYLDEHYTGAQAVGVSTAHR